MKKLFLLFAAIVMTSTGLWADQKTVSYLYPVYNTDGVPTSGIKEWKKAEVTATVLTGQDTQRDIGTGWYVVTSNSEISFPKGLSCTGKVHLILADKAQLIAKGDRDRKTPGIRVTGTASLTIYGQDRQSGELIASVPFGDAAGIGGGYQASGSNITINGGTITATGGGSGAGIGGGDNAMGSNITINGGVVTATGGAAGAGIGGGRYGRGCNITINGGTVTANGGGAIGTTGIGGGQESYMSGSSSENIFIATDRIIKADSSNPPETVTENDGRDLASSLDGKRYVKIEKDLTLIKTAAIAEINGAVKDITYTDVLDIAYTAITNIDNATNEISIFVIKTKALTDIAFALAKSKAIAEITSARQGIKDTDLNNWIDAAINDIQRGSLEASPSIDEIKDQILYMINLFQNGKAEGKTEALGALGTKQNGPAVKVTDKDDNEIILYAPKKVEYIKVKEN